MFSVPPSPDPDPCHKEWGQWISHVRIVLYQATPFASLSFSVHICKMGVTVAPVSSPLGVLCVFRGVLGGQYLTASSTEQTQEGCYCYGEFYL